MEPVASAREIVAAAIGEFGSSLIVLSSFQREDVIVTDLALSVAPATRILTLDTGRVPAATNRVIAEIERRYSISVERIVPDTHEVDSMVGLHGLDLFRDRVPYRMLCCEIRKSRPLARGLRGVAAYLTGLRRASLSADVSDDHGTVVADGQLGAMALADPRALDKAESGTQECNRGTNVGVDEYRHDRRWWHRPVVLQRRSSPSLSVGGHGPIGRPISQWWPKGSTTRPRSQP